MSEATMRAEEYKIKGATHLGRGRCDPLAGMGSHWRYGSPGSGVHIHRRESRRVKIRP